MDEQFDFRALLLKLQDHLSDADRRRLHFLVGDIIPRQIRDDPSLNGTLNLLETLFDQAMINEQDFSYLIRAFNQIRCYDAVNRLKEHQRSKQDAIKSEVLGDNNVEDKMRSTILFQTTLSASANTVKSTLMQFPSSTNSQDQSIRKVPNAYLTHLKQSIKPRYILCQLALLVLNIIGIITIIIISRSIGKQNNSSNEVMLVKAGLHHGSVAGGIPFNDAADCSLTFDDRLIEVRGGGSVNVIEYVTFFYSNGKSRQHGSKIFHNNQTTYNYRFKLNPAEHIDGVTVYTSIRFIENMFIPNGTFLVVGFQFQTDQGRKSELFGSTDGQEVHEKLPDYLLGYTRGQEGGYIDALQFIWYRKVSRTATAVLTEY